MIKFGVPSVNDTVDHFPGETVITVHSIDKPNAKRKFSLSKSAAEVLGVKPGLSKVGFSFDGGRFIAEIPEGTEGVPNADRFLVNKELAFMNKKAHDFFVKEYNLDTSKDNYIDITSVEDMEGIKVGVLSSTTKSVQNTDVEEEVVNTEEDELL